MLCSFRHGSSNIAVRIVRVGSAVVQIGLKLGHTHWWPTAFDLDEAICVQWAPQVREGHQLKDGVQRHGIWLHRGLRWSDRPLSGRMICHLVGIVLEHRPACSGAAAGGGGGGGTGTEGSGRE